MSDPLAAFDAATRAAGAPPNPDAALAAFDAAQGGPPADMRVANIARARIAAREHWWDYPAAILQNLAGDPFQASNPISALGSAAEAGGKFAERFVAEKRPSQAIVGAVPLLGEPVAEVLGPSYSYAEGKAPTHEENVAAVGAGAGLTAMLVAPKVIKGVEARVANMRAAKVHAATASRTARAAITHTPEEIALAERAGEAQAVATRSKPWREDLLDKMRARTEPTPQAPVEASTTPSKSQLREQLFALDAEVKAAEEAHIQAIAEADARPIEETPFGKPMRGAVSVDGKPVEWMTPKQAEAARAAMTAEAAARVDRAHQARNAFYEELSQAPPEPAGAAPAAADVAPEAAAESAAPSAKTPIQPLFEPHGTAGVDSMNPIPSVNVVTAAAKRLAPVKEFAEGLAPAAASPSAGESAGIIREANADIANAAAVERYKHRAVAKTFDKATDVQNIENISSFERTGTFASEPTPGYSDFYRDSTDAAHATLQDVYGEDRVGYVENYVRRAFKFGSKADQEKGSNVLSNYVGSLSASKSPLKGRVLNVPLEDALAQMRAAGVKVEPATTNPELLRQWTVENANQARAYRDAWQEAKGKNLITFLRAGSRVPNDLVALNDRVAQVFFPSEQGMVNAGRYYADPTVARIFNNAISKGLGGSPTFRTVRAINNAYNQFQLGFSGFHLTGTAINATVSDLALGLQQLASGEVAAAVRSVGRSAVPGYSFIRDMLKGRGVLEGLANGDAKAAALLEERINPAGARLNVDAAYRNAAYDNMMRAWRNSQYLKAAVNVPLAIVQKAAAPLMEYAIPRVKIGAFLDLAEAQLQRLGSNATQVERRAVLARAWDSIDNRFGMLTHDNLFWNKTARDLAQISTRSVGWNLGTLRELGGGVLDLAKGEATPRMYYSLSLPIVAGTIGAIYQFLHTGKRPTEPRDYFYPQNGATDRRGRPDRTTLPTYMKDIYAYSEHPVLTLEHKTSPILSMAADLATNRDYFGDMVRNPADPVSRQLLQVGGYALSQLKPFSLQQAEQTIGENASPEQIGERFMGFVKSPTEVRETDDEAAMRRARLSERYEREKRRRAGRQ